MKYMVMTTKHHDGFCLFDSQYTDFTSVKTASRRDFVAEYVEACRAEGLKVGLYFSAKDWQFQGYFDGPVKNPEGWNSFIEFYCNQVKELCSNYGKIDVFWFDGGDMPHFQESPEYSPMLWNAVELENWMRNKQPDMLINGRSGMRQDFKTPEKQGYSTSNPSGMLVELCETMGDSWGYCPNEQSRPVEIIFRMIMDAATNACNLLLNVSPDPDGIIPQSQQHVLNRIGAWLEKNGEAFYGSERILPAWWEYVDCGKIATRGNNAYLIIPVEYYPGDGVITLWKLGNKVLNASILSNGENIQCRQQSGRTVLSGLPSESPDELAVVIKMELEGKPTIGRADVFYELLFGE
jgi:alpha-L-fucosidase